MESGRRVQNPFVIVASIFTVMALGKVCIHIFPFNYGLNIRVEWSVCKHLREGRHYFKNLEESKGESIQCLSQNGITPHRK